MRKRHLQCNMQIPGLPITLPTMDHRMISNQELSRGTNNFCESNLLGTGGFGSVYKGILFDGTIIAVKVLNLQLEGAFKSFDAECKVLRAIQHRNLVKVKSTCSNLELRALVFQYMSNGSLEKWLYSHNNCLNLVQRVSIMVDVASALEYLHNGQLESVVHCDLKPSNILLDRDMVAHVSNFGIAKILALNKDATQTKTLGTLGHIAADTNGQRDHTSPSSQPLVEAHPSHSSSLIGSEDGDRHSSDRSAASLHSPRCSALAAWLLPLLCSMLADPDRHSKSPRNGFDFDTEFDDIGSLF
ncbi:hypothetical protein SO802_012023 [Lithocarpus litseifolius]|uniref:non-specific serine/threonine protein kinase n=1 Tax=Lithocarpus litseifolius TaxID=425828 RepID=A0AAW2D1L5_9ROSI